MHNSWLASCVIGLALIAAVQWLMLTLFNHPASCAATPTTPMTWPRRRGATSTATHTTDKARQRRGEA